jgi:hypothetical protein
MTAKARSVKLREGGWRNSKENHLSKTENVMSSAENMKNISMVKRRKKKTRKLA